MVADAPTVRQGSATPSDDGLTCVQQPRAGVWTADERTTPTLDSRIQGSSADFVARHVVQRFRSAGRLMVAFGCHVSAAGTTVLDVSQM